MSPVLALKALNVFLYCCYSSPLVFPTPILHPSSFMSSSLCSPTVHSVFCPHLTFLPIKSLSLVSLSLSVLSLWPHLCPCPDFFHSFIVLSVNLTCPISRCVIFIHFSYQNPLFALFPHCLLLRPAHLWISIHTRNPRDSMDTSTRLTSTLSIADRH